MLGMPLHKVRVVSHYVGGQFGRNDTGDQPLFIFTALLARRTGRPVKFKHTRREAFHDSRQPAIYTARAAATRDRTIPTALTFRAIGNVAVYADHSMFALKFGRRGRRDGLRSRSEREDGGLRRLHQQAARLHDAGGRQLATQLQPGAHRRRPGREAGHLSTPVDPPELRPSLGTAAGPQPGGGARRRCPTRPLAGDAGPTECRHDDDR